MNKDFLVTVGIIVGIVIVYAVVLSLVFPIDNTAVASMVLPGK